MDYGAHMGRINVLAKTAGNEFQSGRRHVTIKFWTRWEEQYSLSRRFLW